MSGPPGTASSGDRCILYILQVADAQTRTWFGVCHTFIVWKGDCCKNDISVTSCSFSLSEVHGGDLYEKPN